MNPPVIQPGAEGRLYAKSVRYGQTDKYEVIISNEPREGWLDPVSIDVLDLLRRLRAAGHWGISVKTLSPSQIESVRTDIEGVLGLRVRWRGMPTHAVLVDPVAIVEPARTSAEAA